MSEELYYIEDIYYSYAKIYNIKFTIVYEIYLRAEHILYRIFQIPSIDVLYGHPLGPQ